MTFEQIMSNLLPLALLAGVIGLDVVSVAQVMVSRPIVAATLGGTLMGAPLAGLFCGAALECLALEALPVGASRYPEWGSASVAAGAVAAVGSTQASLPPVGAFAVAVFVGIATAWAGGWSMVQHRRLVGAMARRLLPRLAAGDRGAVIGLQGFGLGADLLRGAAVGALFYVPGAMLASRANVRWAIPDDISRAVVVTCVAAVAAAAVWKDFHAISGTRRLFLLSLAVGTVLVVLGV